MSSGQDRQAIAVPGPSASTDGAVRVAAQAALRVIMHLQGAADAVRSLGR